MIIRLVLSGMLWLCLSQACAEPLQLFPLSDVRLTEGPFLDAQNTDLQYPMELDPDKLLAPYLRESGLVPKQPSYGNWESSGLDGHMGGHYLSALALMFASTGDLAVLARLNYFVAELKRCQTNSGTGYLGGIPGGMNEVLADVAEMTGQQDWLGAARFFWQSVVAHRTVAIGGNSVKEHFHDENDFSSMLDEVEGPETCNTYNMLKLTEMLFLNRPNGEYGDYYERALYNHILSSQHPGTGGFVYFTPMRPNHYRVYSQVDKAMWCCVGSGLESQAKYGAFIYAQTIDAVAPGEQQPEVDHHLLYENDGWCGRAFSTSHEIGDLGRIGSNDRA